jgi:hypothetical protein
MKYRSTTAVTRLYIIDDAAVAASARMEHLAQDIIAAIAVDVAVAPVDVAAVFFLFY